MKILFLLLTKYLDSTKLRPFLRVRSVQSILGFKVIKSYDRICAWQLDSCCRITDYWWSTSICSQNYDMQNLTLRNPAIGEAVLYLPFGPRLFLEGMVLLSFMPKYPGLFLIEILRATCRLYYLRRKIFNSLTSLSRAFSASYCTAVVAITLFMLLLLLLLQK